MQSIQPHSRRDFWRPLISSGLCGILTASAGGLLGLLSLCTYSCLLTLISEYWNVHRYTFNFDSTHLTPPSVACSLVFGLAGVLWTVSAGRVAFLRCLLVAVSAGVFSLFVVAMISSHFQLGAQTKTSDPHRSISLLIATIIPAAVAATLVAYYLRLAYRASEDFAHQH